MPTMLGNDRKRQMGREQMQVIHGREFDAVNYDFEALRSALISHIDDLIQKVPEDSRELYKVFVRPSINYQPVRRKMVPEMC